jgi:phage shock protein PspC (stress-responsive transcriptional regulator)
LVPIVIGAGERHSGGMTLTDTVPPDHSTPPPEEPPILRRSASKRVIAGVAGGIAERFDLDVNLVRVGFVVLTCLWGLGAAIYLAMWVLVPSAKPADAQDAEPRETTRSTWLTALLVAGAVVVGLVVLTPFWVGPRWGGGIGLGWLLFLGLMLVLALRHPIGKISFVRVLGVLALAAITVFIVAVGSFFAVVAMTGVPLSGGIGERVWQPTSVAQLQPTYRTAVGSMTLDLRQVPFRGVTHVTASVAVGRLLVEVPPGVIVDVTAHSGVGTVVYENGTVQAFTQSALSRGTASHRTAQLVLDAEVGVGQVQLLRASPLAS